MNRKVTVPLAILCLAYAVLAVLAVHRLGFSRHLEEILFSSPDGVGYGAVSDYLAGGGEKPREYLALRPFFYPLVLSAHHLTGATGFILFQALLSVGTLILVFLAVQRITRSALFSAVAFLVVLLHPTFTIVALHAMPETLCLFLMAAILFCIALFCLHPNKPALFISLFLLSCAACSKPSFLPFFVLWAAFAAFWACRETVKREGQRIRLLAIAVPALILSVSPVLFQLAQTYRSIGQAVISTASRENFDVRFFPAVYGYVEQDRLVRYEDAEGEKALKLYPDHAAKTGYMRTHPRAALKAAAVVLFENLTAGSVFVGYPQEFVRDPALCHRLYRLSTFMNRRCFVLHAGFLLLLPVWLLMLRRDPVARRPPGHFRFARLGRTLRFGGARLVDAPRRNPAPQRSG
ncbi:MAG: hypothetical protein NTV79_00085 [Candidatus Aureabacteria bacterium]|nr:hypothetical protein [Candidatus Auribacterota bacterium]